MADRFERSVVRISDLQAGVPGPTRGTGFLIAEEILVTCAHVLGGAPPTSPFWVTFAQAPGAPACRATVIDGTWPALDGTDVALLRLESAMPGLTPLRLSPTLARKGTELTSYGFPQQTSPDGHLGHARVQGQVTHGSHPVLQLADANDLARGFSGAPLVDDDGFVVGMVTAHPALDTYGKGANIAYAVPSPKLILASPAAAIPVENPYPGLLPFATEQARWFHGRDRLVEELLARLGGPRRVTMLLGPSGSGKSSLVTAGMIPQIEAGRPAGLATWPRAIRRPGVDLTTLTDDLHQLATEPGLLVIDQFEQIIAAASRTGAPAPGNAGGPDEGRRLDEPTKEVLALLQEAAEGRTSGRILLVMRNDFYPELARSAQGLLRALETDGLMNIPADITAAELDEIITAPARAQRWDVTDELSNQLSLELLDRRTSTAPVTCLPLLALTMNQLWDRTVKDSHFRQGVLTKPAYDRVGGLATAFADACEDAIARIPTGDRDVAKRILTALVHDGDRDRGVPITRRTRQRHELQQLAATAPQDRDPDGQDPEALTSFDAALATLVKARIVITTSAPNQQRTFIDLAHDSLIDHWPTLRRWLDQDREYRTWLDRTTQLAEDWEKKEPPRDPGRLLRGGPLNQALDYRRGGPLPAAVERFVDQSHRLSLAIERARRRRIRIYAAVTAAAVAIAGVAGWQWKVADTQQRRATANSLAAQSRMVQGSDPGLSNILALAAVEEERTQPAMDAALQALGSPVPYVATALKGHTKPVNAIAFSPDGTRLATASADHTARVWDTATAKPLASLTGHTDSVNAVAFSPDELHLATASADHTAKLWNADTWWLFTSLTQHTTPVNALAFSPDGALLATGSDNGGRVWDRWGYYRWSLKAPVGGPEVLTAEAFAPDGRHLATASANGTARIWDATTGAQTAVLAGHGSSVNAVVFAPDGARVATASSDDTARIWSPVRHQPIVAIRGHAAPVNAVAFSPDGVRLATASNDGTARIWDATTGTPSGTLTGHKNSVTKVTFTRDGTQVVTASADGTARIWDAATGHARRSLGGFSGWILDLALSPDGTRLAAASIGDSVRIESTSSGGPLLTLTGTGAGDQRATAVAFSPDGTRLATASNDGTVRIWDAGTGVQHKTLTGHTATVTAVAFSPDGTRLATASNDGTARVWNPTTGAKIATLTGHSGRVTAVAFSPDGTRLATASSDGVALVIPIPARWPDLLCERAGRNLTQAEWRTYFGDSPYRRHCARWPSGTQAAAGAPVLDRPAQ